MDQQMRSIETTALQSARSVALSAMTMNTSDLFMWEFSLSADRAALSGNALMALRFDCQGSLLPIILSGFSNVHHRYSGHCQTSKCQLWTIDLWIVHYQSSIDLAMPILKLRVNYQSSTVDLVTFQIPCRKRKIAQNIFTCNDNLLAVQ